MYNDLTSSSSRGLRVRQLIFSLTYNKKLQLALGHPAEYRTVSHVDVGRTILASTQPTSYSTTVGDCLPSNKMPAFFSRNASSPSSAHPSYLGMTYQPAHAGTHGNDLTYGFPDKQGHYKAPNPTAPMFQPQQQQKIPPMPDYSAHRQEQPVVLPSIHTYDLKFWASRVPEPEPIKAPEEPSAGGLVKHLDYDIQVMADFLHETTLSMYALRERAREMILRDSSTVVTNRPNVPDYCEWLRHVLSATRLPSTTIFMALNNLVKRLELMANEPNKRLSGFGQVRFGFQHNDIDAKRMFIVALIISSKYADDSTFINRSWAEVAKIDVKIINELERDWLMKIEWSLDVKGDERMNRSGWEAWQSRFKACEIHRANREALTTAYRLGVPLKLSTTDVANAQSYCHTLPSNDNHRAPTMNHNLLDMSKQARNGSVEYIDYNNAYPWNPPRIGFFMAGLWGWVANFQMNFM